LLFQAPVTLIIPVVVLAGYRVGCHLALIAHILYPMDLEQAASMVFPQGLPVWYWDLLSDDRTATLLGKTGSHCHPLSK
jgi:hypothetical protein